MIMNINRENYTKSLENIRPSEKFLAETKKLMLEEAAKSAKAEKPSRKPIIMKITPFAAAVACIALIAAVSVNILNDKGVETIQSEEAAIQTETSAEVSEEAAEEAVSDLDTADGGITDDEAITADNAPNDEENAVPAEEPEPNTPALFKANDDNTASDDEILVGANSILADSSDEVEEAVEDEAEIESTSTTAHSHNQYYDIFDDDENPHANDNNNDGNDNAGNEFFVPDSDDGIDDEGDNSETNELVAPAFSELLGGKAAEYPDFSPADAVKLREFLALASQDDINAEVIDANGESSDIFGEKAAALNDSFAKAAEKLVPSSAKSFVPTFSFSFFDNVNGDLLYTVRTDGEVLSLRIKNGGTAYFTADGKAIDAVIAAAK